MRFKISTEIEMVEQWLTNVVVLSAIIIKYEAHKDSNHKIFFSMEIREQS